MPHSKIYLGWVNLVTLSRNDCNNLNPDRAGHLGFHSFLDSDGFHGSVEIGALSILTPNPIKRSRSVLHIFPTHTGASDANRSIPSSKVGWIESLLPESFLTRKKHGSTQVFEKATGSGKLLILSLTFPKRINLLKVT